MPADSVSLLVDPVSTCVDLVSLPLGPVSSSADPVSTPVSPITTFLFSSDNQVPV